MEKNNSRDIQAALAKPFAAEDLEWRLQLTLEDKMCGLAVPYVTNRAIQNRLDDVVGPANWYNDYRPWHGTGKRESQLCGIAIYFDDRKEWVIKWDGAEDTDIEPIKGGLSDSMKRAAVQWGIGRVLYNMDTIWVKVEKKGRSFAILDSERPRLDAAYLSMLRKLNLLSAQTGDTQTPHASANSNVQQRQSSPSTQSNSSESRYEYIVESVRQQNGVSGPSTVLILKDAAGNSKKVFARGVHQDLIQGAELKNVKIAIQQQNAVVYYILEHYDIIDHSDIAA